MGIRNKSRQRKKLTQKERKKLLQKRNKKETTIYKSPVLDFPSPDQISNLELVGHTWKKSDRFAKLAHKHYGDPKMWWVIAWYNQTPTEAHLEVGDVVKIPFPLDKILGYLGV